MPLERFVILLSAFIIVSTMVSFIYHEGVLSTTGSGSDGTDSLQHSYHLANTKKFFILNETLSSLKAELQYIRSSKEPISTIRRQPSNPSNITHGDVIVIPSLKKAEERRVDASLPKKAALFFTMDSIGSYESSSRQGGAAGEILVRRSLEKMFLELDIRVDVKASDQGSSKNSDTLRQMVQRVYSISILAHLYYEQFSANFRVRICRHESLRLHYCGPMDLGCKR